MADNLGFGGYQNPYFDQSVQDSLGDTTRAWNNVQQPAYNAAMVRSGSFGNEGVNQMNQYGQQMLQTSLGRQANDMNSSNFWQGQNFGLQNAQFDKSIYDTTFNQNQQQFQNGINLLGMQNNIGNQNLGFGTTIQNTPMSYYGNFNQQANSIGQGYGTAAGTMTANGSPLMGALAGWQLGSKVGSNLGFGGSGGYGFSGAGTPDYSGASTNGNGSYDAGGGVYNNPSAYIA